ncbi:MAG: acyl-CoA dehydrogenase family protein [bacterium]
MYFGLGEQQIMLQDTLRRFLADTFPLDVVRHDAGQGGEVWWQRTVELGVCGLLVPEEYGGSEVGLLDAQVVAEEMGAAVAPVPYLGSVIVAPTALRLMGSVDLQAKYLPQIASGEARFAIGLGSLASPRDGFDIEVSAGKASGRAAVVADVADATHLLLAKDADSLLIVPRDASGIVVERLVNVDKTRSYAVVTLDKTEVDEMISPGSVHQVVAVGRLALASDSFGAAQHMLNTARDYSLDRFQFDRPIGSFQGIKHQLAQMVTDLEPCRSLLWYSAHAFDEANPEFELHSCYAKSLVDDVAKYVARTAIEIHGGMGYTELLGLHLWFKRIEANRQLLGGPAVTRSRAAQLQRFAEVTA